MHCSLKQQLPALKEVATTDSTIHYFFSIEKNAINDPIDHAETQNVIGAIFLEDTQTRITQLRLGKAK